MAFKKAILLLFSMTPAKNGSQKVYLPLHFYLLDLILNGLAHFYTCCKTCEYFSGWLYIWLYFDIHLGTILDTKDLLGTIIKQQNCYIQYIINVTHLFWPTNIAINTFGNLSVPLLNVPSISFLYRLSTVPHQIH